MVVNTKDAKWTPGPVPGIDVLPLYAHTAYPESMSLLHIAAGAALPPRTYAGGAEIFILDGAIKDHEAAYAKGAWLRLPHDSGFTARSDKGCTLYFKQGHLPAADTRASA